MTISTYDKTSAEANWNPTRIVRNEYENLDSIHNMDIPQDLLASALRIAANSALRSRQWRNSLMHGHTRSTYSAFKSLPTYKLLSLTFPNSGIPAGVTLDQSLRHRILSPTVRKLANQLWAIIHSKALQSRFPIDSAYLEIDDDPTEGFSKVLIVINSSAKASQVLAFWDGLGSDIDRWMAKLDRSNYKKAIDGLDVHFNWVD